MNKKIISKNKTSSAQMNHVSGHTQQLVDKLAKPSKKVLDWKIAPLSYGREELM